MPLSKKYWLSVRYMHQGEEQFSQPDFSWDPGNFDADWNQNWSGGYATACANYGDVGDTFLPPAGEGFYPGESRTLFDASTYVGDINSADGNNYLSLVSGEDLWCAAQAKYYKLFSTSPVMDRSHWLFRVRGVGTLSFGVGVDTLWTWTGTGADITLTPAGTRVINSPDAWIDVCVAVPVAQLTHLAMMASPFIARVEVTDGSIDIDYVDWRAASSCGYCIDTGNVVPTAPAAFGGTIVVTTGRQENDGVVIAMPPQTEVTEPDWHGWPDAKEVAEPATIAIVDTLQGGGQILTYAAGDPLNTPVNLSDDTGLTYKALPDSPHGVGPSVVASVEVPRWDHRNYFYFNDGTTQSEYKAAWGFGQLRNPPEGLDGPVLTSSYARLTVATVDFDESTIELPTQLTPEEFASVGLIEGIHYSSTQVTFSEGVDSIFQSYLLDPHYLDFNNTPAPSATWNFHDWSYSDEGLPGHEPVTLHLEYSPLWTLGGTLPGAGFGGVLSTVTFTDPLNSPATGDLSDTHNPEQALTWADEIPFDHVAFFVYSDTKTGGARAVMHLATRIVPPPVSWYQLEWMFLGAVTTEAGPVINEGPG